VTAESGGAANNNKKTQEDVLEVENSETISLVQGIDPEINIHDIPNR
jgi:hypothetical protein